MLCPQDGLVFHFFLLKKFWISTFPGCQAALPIEDHLHRIYRQSVYNCWMSGFINLDTWKRREHFQIFSRLANPFWSICADVDVTRLRQECHEDKGQSFSLT